jgi:molecular chaperone HscC
MATIGIDLGTTNSLVAYWTENGPQTIPNVLGESLTPSVVSVDEDGNVYVGQIAKERLITHPDRTASTFKRQMGTAKTYNLGQLAFTPEELSSLVLRSLKADAEAYLHQNILEAVISVPAYFNDDQRKATKRAAELAGLRVERLISEPTAAAIAYGMHQESSETKFLVIDLGGGTFDVSILEMFDGIMEVKAVAGDTFLGGEDFTEEIISHYLKKMSIQSDDISEKFRSAIYKQAENCKTELTTKETSVMRPVLDGVEKTLEISRFEFDEISKPLILRLRQPIERAMRDADLRSQDLDAIILVGGATRMPIIRTTIARMFGKLPYSNINPDEAIAMGAAVQAALKERNESLSEVILTDVCPFTLGTAVSREMSASGRRKNVFYPVIERNSTIPISRVERFGTVNDFQTFINFGVYQGESRNVENNLLLGEMKIIVPRAKAGEEDVDVRYTYDINGILEVESCVLSTGDKRRLIIESRHGNMTQEQIEECIAKLADIKIHPRDRTENRLLLARAERMYEESLSETREFLDNVILKFDCILELQDEKKTAQAAEELKNILDDMEGRFTL